MPVVYSYIVHKDKGHVGDSPVFQILSNFISLYGKPLFMVSLPGYLSFQIKDIDDFSNKLKSIFPNAYFTIGMNGDGILPTGIKRRDYINSKFNNRGISISAKRDHSKMMFLFECNQNNLLEKPFNLDGSKCVAVLIGSSNQNLTTYFKRANYGESDVLLIDLDFARKEEKVAIGIEENYDEYALSLVNNINEKILISISKEINNSNFLQKLVKEIL